MYVMIGTVLGELDTTNGMEVPVRDGEKNGGRDEGGWSTISSVILDLRYQFGPT